MQLNHITIRTDNLPETKDFFLKVFDLEERDRPQAIQHIPGHWLYAKNKPIIHLIGSNGYGIFQTTANTFDHVGFELENYCGFQNKLDDLGIRYSTMELPELAERRLFFRTPSGMLLETVFSENIHEHKKIS